MGLALDNMVNKGGGSETFERKQGSDVRKNVTESEILGRARGLKLSFIPRNMYLSEEPHIFLFPTLEWHPMVLYDHAGSVYGLIPTYISKTTAEGLVPAYSLDRFFPKSEVGKVLLRDNQKQSEVKLFWKG